MGAGDNGLRFGSTGTGGPASRFISFNNGADWAGNYLTAQVTAIKLDVNNTGAANLNLRLGFDGPGGDWVTDRMIVNTGSGWQSVLFDIQPGSLIGIGGASDASATLGAVSGIQILSAENTPGVSTQLGGLPLGDVIAATAFFDNITATSITAIPEPTSALFVLLPLMGATMVHRRRRL